MAVVKKKMKKAAPKLFDSSCKNPKAVRPTLHPLEVNDPRAVGMTQKSKDPKEWKLTLHRATNTKMGFAHEDNFARFGKQYGSDVKSFGWVYVPLAIAKRMKTLIVTVSELADEE